MRYRKNPIFFLFEWWTIRKTTAVGGDCLAWASQKYQRMRERVWMVMPVGWERKREKIVKIEEVRTKTNEREKKRKKGLQKWWKKKIQRVTKHIVESIYIEFCGSTTTIPLILFLLQIKLIFTII